MTQPAIAPMSQHLQTMVPQGKPSKLIIDPLGNTTQIFYDFAHIDQDNSNIDQNNTVDQGNTVLQISTIDPQGNQKIQLIDSFGKEICNMSRNPQGELIQKERLYYDPCLRLIASHATVYNETTPKNTLITEFTYDAMGQLIHSVEAKGTPEEKNSSFTYNTYGQKIETLTPNGMTLFHEYDIFGRQTTLRSSDHTIHYTYSYDLKDRPLTVKDHLNQTENKRTYDRLGRLTTETLDTGIQLHYGYDSLDRLLLITYPDQTTAQYQYNACHLTAIERLKNNTPIYTHRYQYDLAGYPTLEELIHHTGTVKKQRDPCHRITHIQAPHREETLTYDNIGNLTTKNLHDSQGLAIYTFSYDHLNQLTKETGGKEHTYQNDSLNNRTKKDNNTYNNNALNQLTHERDVTYHYDANGNLTKKESPNQTTLYTYDALNRLTKVNDHTTYTYDSYHRRLTKNHKGILEKFLYHNQQEIGTITNEKISQLRILGNEGVAIALELEQTIYVPLHDAANNVVTLLDLSSNPIETYRYTAFGEQEIFGNTPNPWRYSSKRFDPETGFIYFGRRYYAPEIGRWITPDPAGFEDGPNLYAYLHNSPLIHIDPDGQLAFLIPLAINVAISYAAQYAIPIAAASLQQYAGGTLAAALLTGVVNGYTGHYSSGLFDYEIGLNITEKAGMAIGTVLSFSPSRITTQSITNLAKTELASNVTNKVASKFVRRISWFSTKTARHAAKTTTATTVTKTSQIAANRGIVRVSEKGMLQGKQIWNAWYKEEITPFKMHFHHWKDHGREFPNLQNAKQYVEQAHNLFRNPSVLHRIRSSDGAYLRYDPLTNTFGSFTPVGVPKTMFKPGISKPLDLQNIQILWSIFMDNKINIHCCRVCGLFSG